MEPTSIQTETTDDGAAAAACSSRRTVITVNDVNCHLTCAVCKGYLIDATTITECLHSFCRSCVVPHVSEHHSCPLCLAPLSTTKPFSQLRRDYTLQSIVFKMVPRLARSELERRDKFRTRKEDNNKSDDERYLQSFFAPGDPISLSLEYAEPNCMFGVRRRLDGDSSASSGCQHRRYFRCPAEMPIGALVKFLRSKFDVTNAKSHKLEILYNGQHPLAPEYRLSDVAYIFSWKEREPLRLWYRITPSLPASAVVKKEEPSSAVSIQPEEQMTPPSRASLVDITSKRSWEANNTAADRPAKRRKKEKPAKIQRPAAPLPEEPAHQTAEDVKSNTATIFDDDVRPSEFSCSTPIPAGNANTHSTVPEEPEVGSTKLLNWLPKAVFDLDDRALFAKRLQREKIITTNTPAAAEEPEAPKSSAIPPVVKSEPPEDEDEDGNKPLDPLHICVPSDDPKDPAEEEEVHDSIGALDLSGSKSDASSSSASPLSSGSICSPRSGPAAPSSSSAGPHPYFMTPSAVYQQSSGTAPPTATSASSAPLWDLMQHVQQVQPSSAAAQHHHQSLFSLLFRHAAAAASAAKNNKSNNPLVVTPSASNSSAM